MFLTILLNDNMNRLQYRDKCDWEVLAFTHLHIIIPWVSFPCQSVIVTCYLAHVFCILIVLKHRLLSTRSRASKCLLSPQMILRLHWWDDLYYGPFPLLGSGFDKCFLPVDSILVTDTKILYSNLNWVKSSDISYYEGKSLISGLLYSAW